MSSNEESGSEIARFRQRIALETEAMQRALYAPAVVARHSIITHRYNALGKIQDELALVVGEEKAAHIAAQAYLETMEGWQAPKSKPSLLDVLNEHNKDRARSGSITMIHLAHDARVELSCVVDLARGKEVEREVAHRIIASLNKRIGGNYTEESIAVVFSE